VNAASLTIATALIGLAAGSVAVAQLSTADRASVEACRTAIRSAQSGHATRAIESAFTALESMRVALLEVRNGHSVIESLSDEEFRRLRLLPCAVINREEVLLVKPEVECFVKLARARGDRADRAFTAALKTTYPDSVWPVYTDQQTDYSGCTRFGTKSLVATYRAWSEFQRAFPGRYVAPAKNEKEAVIVELTESTCACGDIASVERDLSQFLQVFPTSTDRVPVERRLQDLRAGRANIRARCVSG